MSLPKSAKYVKFWGGKLPAINIFFFDFLTALAASLPAVILSSLNFFSKLFSINLLLLLPKLFVTITSAPALINWPITWGSTNAKREIITITEKPIKIIG